LSNRTETINLGRIAGPGIGPVAGHVRAVFQALAGTRCRTHIPRADPAADPVMVGAGAVIRDAAGYLAMAAWACGEVPGYADWFRRLISPGDFERLSHVAVNFQSPFVRAGDASRFCSSNEQ